MDAGGSIIEHGGKKLIFLDAIEDREDAIVEGLIFEFEHRVHGLNLFLVGRLKLLSDFCFQFRRWSSLHNSLIQIYKDFQGMHLLAWEISNIGMDSKLNRM